MNDTPRLTRAEAAKATRARVLKAARDLFQAGAYEDATIRAIARAAGMSTGAVFAHFADKAAVWKAAMETDPPIDSPVTRAAGALREQLQLARREYGASGKLSAERLLAIDHTLARCTEARAEAA